MLKNFLRDENGAGSAWAIMWVIICVGLGGLALDGSNAWRHKQMLRATADTAAHAALVTLERGGTPDQARAVAAEIAHANLPVGKFGDVVPDPATDIQIGRYQAASGTITSAANSNAVAVTTKRNAGANSQVTTFFLRLIGFTGWDVAAQGAAAITNTERCDNDGIFAHGQVHLSNQNDFREGYCVHSQNFVWMPQQNQWFADTSMSMPDLTLCEDKCVNTANPGVEEAMSEMNLLLPQFGTLVDATLASFYGTGPETIKQAFFTGKALDGDLSPLLAAGIGTEGLALGSTLTLTEEQFESITTLPEGLVYMVDCSAGHGQGHDTTSNGRLELTPNEDDSAVTNLAIITNCKIDIVGSLTTSAALIVTSDTGSNAAQAAISGSADSNLGTAGSYCSTSEHTGLLAKGRIHFAAKLTANNVTFMTSDEIHFAAKANDESTHTGTMILTDSDVHITSDHIFHGYPGNSGTYVDPVPRIIHFVHI